MARHNIVFLRGFVSKFTIGQSKEGEEFAMIHVSVARGERNVGDKKLHMKLDAPLVMTRNEAMVKEMKTWEENDIVDIKGVITAKAILKGSFCRSCGEKNTAEGALVYVNPIYCEKLMHLETKDECQEYLSSHREISNISYTIGTLCRDPKLIRPKEGLTVAQYQIALNRKYRIQSDPPQIKSDYPWVKSYGENAISDMEHLHVGSHVFIDGCLQARNVQRHKVCDKCGTTYEWMDKAMEIVPYETEYLANFYSEEEIAERKERDRENAVKNVLSSLSGYGSDETE